MRLVPLQVGFIEIFFRRTVDGMRQSETNTKRERVIDENLKRVYAETLEEGIPDRFRDLLDALKQQENSSDTKK